MTGSTITVKSVNNNNNKSENENDNKTTCLAEISTYSYEVIKESADYLLDRTTIRPLIGIICGSGLNSLADNLTDTESFEYKDIPNFPVSTVEGHVGRMVFGFLEGLPVMAMQGRVHYYEGYTLERCSMPVRVMKLVGIQYLMATNAVGGLNPKFKVGDIMIVRDQINIMGFAGNSSLLGPNDARFGQRFPHMTDAYDEQLISTAKKVVREMGIENVVHEGVLTCLGGPNYETVAELKALRTLGVDAVGMSVIHEVITARHCDLTVFAFSLITNKCALDYDSSDDHANHDEVVMVGKSRQAICGELMCRVIREIAVEKNALDNQKISSQHNIRTESKNCTVTTTVPQQHILSDERSRHEENYSYEEIKKSADYLLDRTTIRPLIGIICGSGLNSLADNLTETVSFKYKDIPNFPVSTVEGHVGRMVFGFLEGLPVMAMQGRVHYYEGYTLERCSMPVRVMKLVGIQYLMATNAVGGLNPKFKVGDIMIVRDQINIMGFAGNSSLLGPNDARFGQRFPHMTDAYDEQLISTAKKVVREMGIENVVHEGVLTCLGGPNYETVAELKALRTLGVDAVGMSVIHEVITARHCDLTVFAFSLITNKCPLDYDKSDDHANHDEVVMVGKSRQAICGELMCKVIREIAHDIKKKASKE